MTDKFKNGDKINVDIVSNFEGIRIIVGPDPEIPGNWVYILKDFSGDFRGFFSVREDLITLVLDKREATVGRVLDWSHDAPYYSTFKELVAQMYDAGFLKDIE